MIPIDILVASAYALFEKINPDIITVLTEFHSSGAAVYLVGGTVRDLLLELPTNDLDFEIHGIEVEKIEKLLKKFFVVRLVGKSFGIFRTDKYNIDWSLPRVDGAGRKPSVALDPFLEERLAFKRRDFTINALGLNLKTNAFVDHFNGYDDLKNGILRACDPEAFIQDPLRFYRVFFMLGCYASKTDSQLDALCSSMNLQELSFERIEQEFYKWLERSTVPSRAILWLEKIGRLKELFPELSEARFVLQDPVWHPEGDVLTHSLQTVDYAALKQYETLFLKRLVVCAALFHDIGKNKTSQMIDGKIRSHGHAQVGARMVDLLLRRFTRNAEFITTVKKLIWYHMHPMQFVSNNVSASSYKKLASELHPHLTIATLALLLEADQNGRKAPNGEMPQNGTATVQEFCKQAISAGVWMQPEKPLLSAQELLKKLSPGPHIGLLLREAYFYQIKHKRKTLDEIIAYVRRHPAFKKAKNK